MYYQSIEYERASFYLYIYENKITTSVKKVVFTSLHLLLDPLLGYKIPPFNNK